MSKKRIIDDLSQYIDGEKRKLVSIAERIHTKYSKAKTDIDEILSEIKNKEREAKKVRSDLKKMVGGINKLRTEASRVQAIKTHGSMKDLTNAVNKLDAFSKKVDVVIKALKKKHMEKYIGLGKLISPYDTDATIFEDYIGDGIHDIFSKKGRGKSRKSPKNYFDSSDSEDSESDDEIRSLRSSIRKMKRRRRKKAKKDFGYDFDTDSDSDSDVFSPRYKKKSKEFKKLQKEYKKDMKKIKKNIGRPVYDKLGTDSDPDSSDSDSGKRLSGTGYISRNNVSRLPIRSSITGRPITIPKSGSISRALRDSDTGILGGSSSYTDLYSY